MSMPIFSNPNTLILLKKDTSCEVGNTIKSEASFLLIFSRPSNFLDEIGLDLLEPFQEGHILDVSETLAPLKIAEVFLDENTRNKYTDFYKTLYHHDLISHYELIFFNQKKVVVPWIFISSNSFECEINVQFIPTPGIRSNDLKKKLKNDQNNRKITIKTPNDSEGLKAVWVSNTVSSPDISYTDFYNKYKKGKNGKIRITYTGEIDINEDLRKELLFEDDSGNLIGKINIKIGAKRVQRLIHLTAIKNGGENVLLKQSMSEPFESEERRKIESDLEKASIPFKQCGIELEYNTKYKFKTNADNLVSELSVAYNGTINDALDKVDDLFSYEIEFLEEDTNPDLEIPPKQLLVVVKWPNKPRNIKEANGESKTNRGISIYWVDDDNSYQTISHEVGHSLGLPHSFYDKKRPNSMLQGETTKFYLFETILETDSDIEYCSKIKKFYSDIRDKDVFYALTQLGEEWNEYSREKSYFAIINSFFVSQFETKNIMDYPRITTTRHRNIDGTYYETTELSNIRNRFYAYQWEVMRLKTKLLNDINS